MTDDIYHILKKAHGELKKLPESSGFPDTPDEALKQAACAAGALANSLGLGNLSFQDKSIEDYDKFPRKRFILHGSDLKGKDGEVVIDLSARNSIGWVSSLRKLNENWNEMLVVLDFHQSDRGGFEVLERDNKNPGNHKSLDANGKFEDFSGDAKQPSKEAESTRENI